MLTLKVGCYRLILFLHQFRNLLYKRCQAILIVADRNKPDDTFFIDKDRPGYVALTQQFPDRFAAGNREPGSRSSPKHLSSAIQVSTQE